ncbi:aminoglycoside phosphotransferase family protein [Streptomyces sp. CC208A]|uniref:aminoglycoside phosphotransferase family protein n=1 Tax=Streptomyces sp. CC208A TaxID=3044573 RepID=UPI0024A90BF9|nr:aminoglycoside phosphotransferase family protein [Streptomyces sp. CC208A]
MRTSDERTTVVDRGRFPDAVTPWDDEEWRREVLGWAGRVLAGHGLSETGAREVRVRPWSVLVRFRTGDGGRDAVWLKAGAPANAFEAGLAEALAAWVPEDVMTPLAVDAGRGCALLPDGGPLFRGVLDAGAAGPEAWVTALGRYAGMQRRLVPYADRITALGVPGARTRELPGVFDALVAGNPLFDAGERAALLRQRPRLVDWCAELDAYGLPDSLDHCDLHDGQILAPAPGRFTFFDWGDACVAHPFGSLLVPVRAVRERYGPEHVAPMVDAYLEQWGGLGPSAAELRRAAGLAVRLAALGRAGSWFRLFPGTPTGDSEEASASWIRELFAADDAW